MTAQTTHPRRLPGDLQSPRSKLVYLYLDAADGATLGELERDLDMPKISLLSVLNKLSSLDHVDGAGPEYTYRCA
ncbi:MarR family transcriptional regulator [Natrialbaceae archaeon GCM10025810]|uniref:MarR family transcriptional regulator n=1 Tax=Halovalidus salilacus TaxID=3075124 RepID=UPI003612F438